MSGRMRSEAPNRELLGIPGSRRRLATPALVLDLDRLERNIAAMAGRCHAAGIALRPHAKTHKSVAIAKAQLAAGAVGIACASIGEAAVMAEAGLRGILVTSPLLGEGKLARLSALRRAGSDVTVVVDHPQGLEALRVSVDPSLPQPVMVDLDIGLHRTGASTTEAAVALARAIAAAPALRFAGLQAYAGQLQHVPEYERRRSLSAAGLPFLRQTIAALGEAGLPPPVVTGGGTGTHEIDIADGTFTELQAGSYVVMDVDYNRIELRLGANRSPFETALFVQASVVSCNHPGFVTVDAGLKRFATDGPRPEIIEGAPPGAGFRFMGDEHGAVIFAEPGQTLPLGAMIACITPHCDPTVNLYDWYHCVRGDTLVDLWPVDARGA